MSINAIIGKHSSSHLRWSLQTPRSNAPLVFVVESRPKSLENQMHSLILLSLSAKVIKGKHLSNCQLKGMTLHVTPKQSILCILQFGTLVISIQFFENVGAWPLIKLKPSFSWISSNDIRYLLIMVRFIVYGANIACYRSLQPVCTFRICQYDEIQLTPAIDCGKWRTVPWRYVIEKGQ